MIGQAWSRLMVTWSRCIWEPFCCRSLPAMLCGEARIEACWVGSNDTLEYLWSIPKWKPKKPFNILFAAYSTLVQYHAICTYILLDMCLPLPRTPKSEPFVVTRTNAFKALYFKFVACKRVPHAVIFGVCSDVLGKRCSTSKFQFQSVKNMYFAIMLCLLVKMHLFVFFPNA